MRSRTTRYILDIACAAHVRAYRGTCSTGYRLLFIGPYLGAGAVAGRDAARRGAVLRDGHRNGPLLIATNVRDLFEKPRSAMNAIRYELLQNMAYFFSTFKNYFAS